MVDHPESAIPRFTNQWPHFRFNWNFGGEESGLGYDVGHFLTNTSLVQVESWENRLNPDQPCIIVVSRVRTADDVDIPGVQLLQ